MQVSDLRLDSGEVLLTLRKGDPGSSCVGCGRRYLTHWDLRWRVVRDLDFAARPCYLRFAHHRVRCMECGGVQPESLAWVFPRGRLTSRLARKIRDLADRLGLSERRLARWFGLDRKTVRMVLKTEFGPREDFPRPAARALGIRIAVPLEAASASGGRTLSAAAGRPRKHLRGPACPGMFQGRLPIVMIRGAHARVPKFWPEQAA